MKKLVKGYKSYGEISRRLSVSLNTAYFAEK